MLICKGFSPKFCIILQTTVLDTQNKGLFYSSATAQEIVFVFIIILYRLILID